MTAYRSQRRRPRISVREPRDSQMMRKHKPDYILILLCMILLVVGLIVVYAISPSLSAQRGVGENYFVSKQLIAIGLGLIAFVVVSIVPFWKWKTLRKPLIIAAVVATLITLITPLSQEYPAHRWIRFGGFSLQSVELIKISMIVGLAAFLESRRRSGEMNNTKKTLRPIFAVLIVIGVVVAVLQRDLGSTVVIVAMMSAMSFIAGLPFVRIAQVAAVAILALMVLVLPFSYRRERITTFVNPERDCQNAGYQACQALIAVGSGGLFGIGLQKSGQAFGYLPEAANDSIFAIIAEKFGFIGSVSLVLLFGVLFVRLKNITERAPDDFSRLVMVGILAWISTQAIINMGAMIGVLPLKGITLPFVSYGGTSVVFVLAAIGLAFNISRYSNYMVNNEEKYLPSLANDERKPNENSVDWRRYRRSYHTDSSRSA